MEKRAARGTARTFPAATDRVAARRKASGFTLIEIIVVVAIIAVAAAVALPSINAGARQREIRRTLQGFVSALRRASSIAVFRRQPVELRILAKEGAYSVVVPTASSGDEAAAATDDEQRRRRRSGLLGRADESTAQADSNEHRVELPELASFGDVEGGRDLGDEGFRDDRAQVRPGARTADLAHPLHQPADQLDLHGGRRVRSERGFTLMEVLIATSVAAIGIVAALELFSGSTRLAGASTDQTQALVIGRSVMDQVLWRIDIEDGTESGELDEYRWTREVVTLEPSLGRGDTDELGEKDEESEDFELKGVSVVVSWTNAGGVDKEIRLSSARIMEKF